MQDLPPSAIAKTPQPSPMSPPLHRLKTRAQFQAVLAGTTVARTPHFALHRCALDAPAGAEPLFGPASDVWLGAMVPKRWARRAVTRNAIKRQIYNVSAAADTVLPSAAVLLQLRSATTAGGVTAGVVVVGAVVVGVVVTGVVVAGLLTTTGSLLPPQEARTTLRTSRGAAACLGLIFDMALDALDE